MRWSAAGRLLNKDRGWDLVASEHWIHGPLRLSNEETGEEWEGRALGDEEGD